MRWCWMALLCVAAPVVAGDGDVLARRGFFGVTLEATESLHGVRVVGVVAGSTAADAWVQPGDIFQKIGTMIPLGLDGLANAERVLASVSAGDVVLLTIIRDDAVLQQVLEVKPLPMESDPDFETIYTSLVSGEVRLRVIITKPVGEGPFPGVLFRKGAGCESVDFALEPAHPVRILAGNRTRRGEVTLRVERAGVGDSEGGPCDEADQAGKGTTGDDAGLELLRSLPYVRAESVSFVDTSEVR